jgi:hypothetical protein
MGCRTSDAMTNLVILAVWVTTNTVTNYRMTPGSPYISQWKQAQTNIVTHTKIGYIVGTNTVEVLTLSESKAVTK